MDSKLLAICQTKRNQIITCLDKIVITCKEYAEHSIDQSSCAGRTINNSSQSIISGFVDGPVRQDALP
jgi:hypothetical protein